MTHKDRKELAADALHKSNSPNTGLALRVNVNSQQVSYSKALPLFVVGAPVLWAFPFGPAFCPKGARVGTQVPRSLRSAFAAQIYGLSANCMRSLGAASSPSWLSCWCVGAHADRGSGSSRTHVAGDAPAPRLLRSTKPASSPSASLNTNRSRAPSTPVCVPPPAPAAVLSPVPATHHSE
jgi:hypothetical protein